MSPRTIAGVLGALAVCTLLDQWLTFEESSFELILIALALPLGLFLNWKRQKLQKEQNAQLKSKFISPPPSPRLQTSEPKQPLKASLRRPGTGGRGSPKGWKVNAQIEDCVNAGDLDGAERLLAESADISTADYNCVI